MQERCLASRKNRAAHALEAAAVAGPALLPDSSSPVVPLSKAVARLPPRQSLSSSSARLGCTFCRAFANNFAQDTLRGHLFSGIANHQDTYEYGCQQLALCYQQREKGVPYALLSSSRRCCSSARRRSNTLSSARACCMSSAGAASAVPPATSAANRRPFAPAARSTYTTQALQALLGQIRHICAVHLLAKIKTITAKLLALVTFGR